jgi:glycine/D-amino acid oxidase-like deaminating enzyme
MERKEYEPALEMLDSTWGLIEESYKVYPAKTKETIWRVDTDEVLEFTEKARNRYEVVSVNGTKGKEPSVVIRRDGLEQMYCKWLVIAAGWWTSKLINMPTMNAVKGVSFRYAGDVPFPFIQQWAPYKQIVAHQQSKHEIWVGDGSSILSKNWTTERSGQCMRRCRDALPEKGVGQKPMQIREGIRPYCDHKKGEPCYFKQLGPRTFVVTGSAKNGTIASGWAAKRILDAIA